MGELVLKEAFKMKSTIYLTFLLFGVVRSDEAFAVDDRELLIE